MMSPEIKAIVLKTAQLKSTRDFFENRLKLPIKESSARHFVVHSKNIRLVFMESQHQFEVELYINNMPDSHFDSVQLDLSFATFKNYKDPNGISIIIPEKNKYTQNDNYESNS